LFLGGGFEALPGESTAKEVHQNISKGLEVVPARLLDTQVSIDGGITSSTRKVLVLPVWNMKVGLRVTELFSKTEVDDVDLIAALANAHQEIVRLDIAVNKIAGVDVLYT